MRPWSCLYFQDTWEKLKADTERKRKLLVVIAPQWSQFVQMAHDLEMNLDAMETNIHVANTNREIHKVHNEQIISFEKNASCCFVCFIKIDYCNKIKEKGHTEHAILY